GGRAGGADPRGLRLRRAPGAGDGVGRLLAARAAVLEAEDHHRARRRAFGGGAQPPWRLRLRRGPRGGPTRERALVRSGLGRGRATQGPAAPPRRAGAGGGVGLRAAAPDPASGFDAVGGAQVRRDLGPRAAAVAG